MNIPPTMHTQAPLLHHHTIVIPTPMGIPAIAGSLVEKSLHHVLLYAEISMTGLVGDLCLQQNPAYIAYGRYLHMS